ncbi:MAG: transposase family protein [Streptomyces sp.]|nr:transposase family protein [Streptomyces sp.]
MPSSLINVLARYCEDADASCPPVVPADLASLAQILAAVPDPRRVRGRRHRLGALLGLCPVALLGLCPVAVLGGARSLAQISRYAAEAGPEVRAELDLSRAVPNASTLGRLLARMDGDPLDDAVGTGITHHATDPVADENAWPDWPWMARRCAGHAPRIPPRSTCCPPPCTAARQSSPSARWPPRATRSRPWLRCWPASTCAAWSSPPTRRTPSARPRRRSSPPVGTIFWSSRATRRTCTSNCAACPGGRSRC